MAKSLSSFKKTSTGNNLRDFAAINTQALGEHLTVEARNLVDKYERRLLQIEADKLVPAPNDMNFFEQLAPEKELELRMSIANRGIIEPLHIWDKNDGTYMILAGHNRANIVKKLYGDTNDEKYLKVPAIVYPYEELNGKEELMREIIIETNCLGRDKFSVKERVQLIIYKINKFKTQKDDKGRNILSLGQELGINKSTIYDDYTIGTKLIPEMLEYYYNNKIRRKTAIVIAKFDHHIQKWIVDEYPNKISDTYLGKVPKGVNTKDALEKYFNREISKRKIMQTEIPEEYMDEFNKMVEEWKKSKGIV